MEKWHLKKSDLKKYPHFDSLISIKDAEALATDPDRVAKHTFYPFILYTQRWTRFAKKGQEGVVKERPIRYASRRDSYIFSRYRHLLSELYENELKRLNLSHNVLAYRRIPSGAEGGKCNIHFANDVFLKIKELQNCCVVALDISSYFDSLDHSKLKEMWRRLLGVAKLPPDHFQVFKAITQYAEVDKKDVYTRLGHFGQKRITSAGNPISGYLTPYKEMPKQLCDGKEFRAKIVGKGESPSIIKMNRKPYGIPQGAPISDLLANFYLLDFDATVSGLIEKLGGAYYRYSDDILLIAPGDAATGQELSTKIRSLIGNFGSKLTIKEKKSSVFVFKQSDCDQTFQLISGNQGRNGLEYLGFRYDGKRGYLRDSTLSNLRRKVARTARREADSFARRYPDKDASRLKNLFNYERLIKKFGRVEDFDEKHEDYRNWTFWTYATRASKVFGPLGKSILRQLRRHRLLIRQRVDQELEWAVIRRERRRAAQPSPN